MTNEEFKEARHKLGLTMAQLAIILNTDPRTIRKWEANDSASTSRAPSPVASRVMKWMLDGFRPPQMQGMRRNRARGQNWLIDRFERGAKAMLAKC